MKRILSIFIVIILVVSFSSSITLFADSTVDDSSLILYLDGPEIGKDWQNIAEGTSVNRSLTAVAGKSDTDRVLQYTIAPGIEILSKNPTRSDTTGIDTANMPKTAITIEFLVRVTGDASANVDMDNGTNLMKFSSDGVLSYYSYDERAYIAVKVCDDVSLWHSVAITYDYSGGRIKYYFDGVELKKTGGTTTATLSQLRFGPQSKVHSIGGTVGFDSLKISRGYYSSSNKLSVISENGKIKVFPARIATVGTLIFAKYDDTNTLLGLEKSNDPNYFEFSKSDTVYRYKIMLWNGIDTVMPLRESTELVNDSYRGINIGTRGILDCDFESGFPLAHHANGSIIELRKEENGNTVLYMERVRETDFHISALGFNHHTDCIVAEFDLKLQDPATYFYIKYKDANAQESTYAHIASGGILTAGNTAVTLQMDKWYRISQVINRYDRIIDTYVDGKKVDTQTLRDNFLVNTGVDLFRFHVPPTTDPEKDKVKFMADNLRIYEGAVPRDEVGEIIKDIDLTLKSYVPDDMVIANTMTDFYSVHTMSGVAYAYGEKVLLKTKPWTENNKVYVDGFELARLFGISGVFSNAMTIEEFTSASKLISTKVDYDFNSGLYIFGENQFEIPEDKVRIKELNDYLFYLRPGFEKILELYSDSPVYGVHPRIQATADDFARIRELIETDETMKRWNQIVIGNADNLLNIPAVEYELRDGVRLLEVSREVLSHMYALGMAYQITGEHKYAKRAWLDLEAVCVNFWDWHPSHIIDTGEMMAAVAIGYDWMYDAFTNEQRSAIEKGILDMGFYEAVLGTQSEAAAMHAGMLFDETNHNVVTNGGLLMACLAFMDVYPEITSYLAHSACRCVEINLDKFAPEGAYFEGPHYWEYTMQYASKMLSSLDSVFGNCFALDSIEGLSTSSEYMIHMQTSNGIYSYGDGTPVSVYPVEILWLSNKYDNSGMFSMLMNITEGNFSNIEDYVLVLLFYNPSLNNQDFELPLEKYYENEGTMSLRKSWCEEDSAFVGIHAGKTKVSHSHLDGASFIYENDGVRWAVDMGAGNYNQVGYWDSWEGGTRWNIYAIRAEAHNTIVVNPSLLPDHKLDSFAELQQKDVNENGAIAVVDTTQLLYDVISSRRGFFFTDQRESLVVRDEINLTKESDVHWFMQTRAEVEIDETGAILTQDGKKLRLDFVTNADATIVFEDSKPLPTSPVEVNDRYGVGYDNVKRINLKVHGSGLINITVKLTPTDIDGTSVDEYNKSIDEWVLSDNQ